MFPTHSAPAARISQVYDPLNGLILDALIAPYHRDERDLLVEHLVTLEAGCLLLFAVLAGATSYQKIITFIAVQRDRLNTAFGACLRRAPAVNTLRRLLERDDLEAAFRRHADELNGTVQVTGKRTIALDGKALRGSFDHLNDRTAAHVLSAFASDAALILAHQEVAGAPGEIPAVPTLMEDLGLTGVLFTADALHCQKDSFTRAAEMACWSR